MILLSSCPALCRASTSFEKIGEAVDGRDESGDDEIASIEEGLRKAKNGF